ncbi:ESCRT-II complex, vps25 subunit [Calocera viscosa TUFC12733]|uniref:ESCRT-II complex, vps25 subunit n=1 Tax=Calocera viscosa (strain TUFC12733) TaxID=1330018 RepID=A0A167S6M7_CALVF|nr:ESCRT-II complex, vps25 subunit [Calocera viscosa TUFC12733]
MGLELAPYQAPSGFLLPSIHSWSAFYTYQPNPRTFLTQSQDWTSLLLAYARFRRLWLLALSDADAAAAGLGEGGKGTEWAEALHNPRLRPPRTISRKILLLVIEQLIASDRAIPDPPKQTSSVVLCWRSVPEWAGVLHEWALKTGQTNTILTLFEISNPAVESELSGMPEVLLRRAIAVLARTGKAQVIEGGEGGGVRFFP